MKRFKWEPAALMVLVLALGLWIAFGPASRPDFPIEPGSLTQTVRIGNTRGLLEAIKPGLASQPLPPGAVPGNEPTFRLWMKGGDAIPRPLSYTEARILLGRDAVEETLEIDSNPVFRTLNITSWVNLVWVGIGLAGQLAFSGRMILQWIVSERRGESVITESFWWCSLFGAVTLFSYFVFRQDPIGILGQASGLVIYFRNLRLIYKNKRRAARTAQPPVNRPEPVPVPQPAAAR